MFPRKSSNSSASSVKSILRNFGQPIVSASMSSRKRVASVPGVRSITPTTAKLSGSSSRSVTATPRKSGNKLAPVASTPTWPSQLWLTAS